MSAESMEKYIFPLPDRVSKNILDFLNQILLNYFSPFGILVTYTLTFLQKGKPTKTHASVL